MIGKGPENNKRIRSVRVVMNIMKSGLQGKSEHVRKGKGEARF